MNKQSFFEHQKCLVCGFSLVSLCVSEILEPFRKYHVAYLFLLLRQWETSTRQAAFFENHKYCLLVYVFHMSCQRCQIIVLLFDNGESQYQLRLRHRKDDRPEHWEDLEISII